MDQNLLREREAKCIQEEPPGCTTTCPVHVDVRGMIRALQKNDYATGLALYQKAVPFPRILARICDQPCQQGCRRAEVDQAIAINALERICIEHQEPAVAKKSMQSPKETKIAVIGAGLSGLTVAFELAKKNVRVTILEAGNRLGGRIWEVSEKILPRILIEQDFASLLQNPLVKVHLNTEVGSSSQGIPSWEEICRDYDAVYLGIGHKQVPAEWGLALNAQGTIQVDPNTLITNHAKVFAGGSLLMRTGKESFIQAIAHGKMAVNSIDRLLQKASLTANRSREGSYPTALYTNIHGVRPLRHIKVPDPAVGFTTEEGLQEAGRCLLCECMECVKVCEYLAHYRSHPKRYVREIYNNLSIVMGIRQANKMINSCSLCGLCEQVCPNGLDMGEICQNARRTMVQKGKMPPSAFDFALRDMAFSTGQQFTLTRHQKGFDKSQLLFFPGCQLSASAPEHVQKLYSYLCHKVEGGVGLRLGCCGAPADWGGQQDLFAANLEVLEGEWEAMGRPRVITGCPTCYQIFRRKLPQMEAETIYTLFNKIGLPDSPAQRDEPKRLAIQDACTTRHDKELHAAIRAILQQLGHQVVELELSQETTQCCGYGGLMMFSHKELAQKTIQRRINQNEADYLAYCAMCRDNFVGQGKRVYHLLDLILGTEGGDRATQRGPGLSQRHENRAKVKRTLLREVWGESMVEESSDIKLMLSEEVAKILEDRMILVSDVIKVMEYAEKTGRRLKNKDSGHFIAYYRPVSVTYWVEYTVTENGYVLQNAYTHRLEINE